MNSRSDKPMHFIQQLMIEELDKGVHEKIVTRFPPEPNGYLHIGHAKSICLNFGLAQQFSGKCFLRFDDTNPLKEEEEFVNAIIEDVAWLGFQWTSITYSSDYYQQLYDFAIYLIENDWAYVDSLTMDQIRTYRGTLQEPGVNSPYRNRSKAENLALFTDMKAGKCAEGTHVLRAKIDMQSANINMRDPVIYRIRFAHHQRSGDAWCIYPMYDYAHPISDALELITHSLCTLEFQDHRPLYDWFLQHLPLPARPVQTEFARLNLSHTVTSKRKLRELVENNIVSGWDDPRLPTLCGMRNRGYPAEAIRNFCDSIGVTRSDSVIDMGNLEECVRSVLNQSAARLMCVQDPLKVVIENYPEHEVAVLEGPFYPGEPSSQTRAIPFSREIFIERSDFMAQPTKGFFRLSLGTEVRLRFAYIIKCTNIIHNAEGDIVEIRAQLDPDTLGKNPEGRKVKGVIHWVSIPHAHPISILQYDRLFYDANPGREENFMQFINHHSLDTFQGYAEPAVAKLKLRSVVQFERLGYYLMNECTTAGDVIRCHRVVGLKDSWGKIEAKQS